MSFGLRYFQINYATKICSTLTKIVFRFDYKYWKSTSAQCSSSTKFAKTIILDNYVKIKVNSRVCFYNQFQWQCLPRVIAYIKCLYDRESISFVYSILAVISMSFIGKKGCLCL